MHRRAVLLAAVVAPLVAACGADEPPSYPSTPRPSDEQRIVESAANAVHRLRSGEQGPVIDAYLPHARAVLIFPRVVKAGLLFGGGGGNGVMVVRGGDGTWSAPAFYGLGGASVGLQVGFQQATLMMFLMSDHALASALGGGFTLVTDVSVAAGTLGDASETERQTPARDIYYVADVAGVFAGLSLDGTVIDERDELNARYYGLGAAPRAIVVERRFHNPGAKPLAEALESSGGPGFEP